jgi:hypothetical protein
MKKREAPKKIFPPGSLIAMRDSKLIGMIVEYDYDSNLHDWYRVEWFGANGEIGWMETLTSHEIKIYTREYKQLRKDLGI